MPFINRYYIISPRNELLDTLEDYPDFDLSKTILWILNEASSPRLSIDEEYEYRITYVKVAFLLWIIKVFENPVITKNFPDILIIIPMLFGSNPQFSIESFDKWWTVECLETIQLRDGTIVNATARQLKRIQKTGNELIDAHIERTIQSKEKEIK